MEGGKGDNNQDATWKLTTLLKKEENKRVHAETIKTYMWIRDAAIMTLYNYFQHTNDCFYTRLAPACVEAIIIIYDSEMRHIVYF